MEDEMEKAYAPREMAVILDIGDSTLRKWSIALEKNGYIFIRNEQNSRVYVEQDIVVLRHFQNLLNVYNMNIKDAANLVADRFGNRASDSRTGIVPVEKEEEQRDLIQSDEVVRKLLEHVQTQEAFNQELLKRLDQQQKYIDERLEERDRKLMESMNEYRENKKLLEQIAATQEEEKKKGFFARLFGK